jgi:formylglycine-generating enzyme
MRDLLISKAKKKRMTASEIFLGLVITSLAACADANLQMPGSTGIEHTALCVKLPSRFVQNVSAEKFEVDASPVKYEGMVWMEGGSFVMGSNEFVDALPLHQVEVSGFYMDEHEVTNAQYAEFVEATGYITVAERMLDPADFPAVPADKLVPGSVVFSPPATHVSLQNPLQWWKYVPGASWKHPEGPGSSIVGKDNDPVVQVSYEDARAYAKWAGKRLPTEAQWEYAARGKESTDSYYWGASLMPEGKWRANIFQGSFPESNTAEDGFPGIAAGKSFAPNSNGLYDMEGNVWEWCSDLYRHDYYEKSARQNPQGPTSSYDPYEPGVTKHVQRGGSFMCSDQYCNRYKAGSRGKGEISSASNNLGFRCVRNVKREK